MDSSILDAIINFISNRNINLGSIPPAAIGWALLAAFGAFLVVANLGIFGNVRMPDLPLTTDEHKSINLTEQMQHLQGDASHDKLAILDGLPLLDRLIGPFIKSIVLVLPHREDEWIENALDLLNYPNYMKSIQDYYAGRVVHAVAGFIGGVLLALNLALANGDYFGFVLYPLLFGWVGYLLPRWTIKSALNRRKDEMLFEAPYVFDRLATSVMAHGNMLQEGVKALAKDEEAELQERMRQIWEARAKRIGEQDFKDSVYAATSIPEGSYLMREMRLVAEHLLNAVPVAGAFEIMAQRNSDVPLIEQFCRRMRTMDQKAGDITDALRSFGDRAVEIVEDMIESRANVNTALMITPSFIALIGMFLVMAAPAYPIINQIF